MADQSAKPKRTDDNYMTTNVVISPNIRKTSERIDPNGNIINPRTRKIIQENTPEYIPSPEEITKSVQLEELKTTTRVPQTTTIAPELPNIQAEKPKDDAMSVLEQIKQAKEHLKALEELKKLKIAEKKAELELLES